MKERFEHALTLQEVDRVPVIVPLNTGIQDLMKASNCYWPDAQRESGKMIKLALAAHEIAGIENVTVPFDNFLEVEAMGCKLEGWSEKSQPKPVPLIDNPPDFKKIRIPNPETDGRMPIVLESIQKLSGNIGDKLPIIAYISAPFEIVSTIWNPNTLINYIEYDTTPLKVLLDKVTSFVITYGKALVNSGATTLTLVDGNSQNLFGIDMGMEYAFDGVEPEYYEEFSYKYVKKVIKALKVPVIYHVCGDTTPILDHMAETGAMGLSVDRVEIRTCKEIVGDNAAVIGNISVETLWKGAQTEIEKEAKRAIEQGVDILAPGCNLVPTTPLENVRAMVNTVLK